MWRDQCDASIIHISFKAMIDARLTNSMHWFCSLLRCWYQCHSVHIATSQVLGYVGIRFRRPGSKSCSHFARLFHFGSFHLASRRGILSAALARLPSPICLSNLSGLGRINSLLCGFSCPSFPQITRKAQTGSYGFPHVLINVEKHVLILIFRSGQWVVGQHCDGFLQTWFSIPDVSVGISWYFSRDFLCGDGLDVVYGSWGWNYGAKKTDAI